jgi:N-ethylmaleimide reductase
VSPYGVFNGGMSPTRPPRALRHLATGLGKLGLLYVHVVDHSAMGAPALPPSDQAGHPRRLRRHVSSCRAATTPRAPRPTWPSGHGELVAFGRPFLANPTLVDKLRTGAELLAADMRKNFTPGPDGYVVE